VELSGQRICQEFVSRCVVSIERASSRKGNDTTNIEELGFHVTIIYGFWDQNCSVQPHSRFFPNQTKSLYSGDPIGTQAQTGYLSSQQ